MTSLQFGEELLSVPVRVVSIPKEELRVINTVPTTKKRKTLSPSRLLERDNMVHPDIIGSQQWTIVTHRKSKAKVKASSSNMVGISIRQTEEDVTSFTSSGEEESALAAKIGTPSTSKTQSGKQYLK